MAKVKLYEVAREYKETSKIKKNNSKIVGLEDLVSNEVTLTKWSENIENTFTKLFKKGQVLFGRRRAYLKKAVVAPFDGICSGDIIVIEALKDKIDESLLPLIIQNDRLFDFAVSKSAGSLSPRVKWEHLKNYEFELPDMDEQKKLANILWSIELLKNKRKNAIAKLDVLITKTREKLFIDNPKNKQLILLQECIEKIVGGGTPSREKQEYFIGDIPWVTVKDISENDVFINSALEHINENALKNSASNLIKANSLIIATRISLDRAAINTVPVAINQDLKALYLKSDFYVKFLYYWYKSQYANILSLAAGTTVLGVRLENIKSLKLLNYNKKEQKEIIKLFDNLEKNKDQLLFCLNKDNDLFQKILNGGQVNV